MPEPCPPGPPSPTVVALRLVAARLGVDAAQACAAGPDGRLAAVATVGAAPDLGGLAAALGEQPTRLDLAGLLPEADFAAGVARGGAALVVLARTAPPADAAWLAALADGADLLAALLRPAAPPPSGSAASHAAARRRAEAFVQALPAAAGVLALDAEGAPRLAYATPAAEALLGPPGAHPPGAHPLAARLDAAGLGRLRLALWHVLAGRPAPPVAVDVLTAAGPRALALALAPLDAARGTVAFVATDDAPRRHAVEHAEAARRRADASASARRELLVHIDHALRSPLTSVLGYADLLDPQASPDDLADIRDVLLRSGERLLASLDDLRDLALADGVAVPVAAAPTDAAALVRAVVDAHRPAAAARQIVLALAVDVGPGPLLLDPALVGRVVRHLVAAAVARPGARHVDARLSEDGGDLVFDLAVREAPALDGAPADAASDGIGPDLVRRLAAAMGGAAEAAPGPQWRWTVRLPRRAVVLVDLPEPAPHAEVAAA